MKKTEWFDGQMYPQQAGVYERDYKNENARECDRQIGKAFCHWNGGYWGMFGRTPDEAPRYKVNRSANQAIPWRGLASDPSKAGSKA